MAVGGIGMVCTANYNARKFGIRAAMPGFIARRLCPELVFVKPDFQKYTKASQATRAIFRDFDPDFEAGSLDEAYLDITACCQQHGMTGKVTATQCNFHAVTHWQWHESPARRARNMWRIMAGRCGLTLLPLLIVQKHC